MLQKNSKTLVASAVSLALSSMILSTAASAEVISGLNTVNFGPANNGIVDVFTDVPPTTNGFIDYEDSNFPGIGVYQETFTSGDTFDGCIMAKLDNAPPALNCAAPQDSSKRIKLNATAVGPTDLVFDVTDDATDRIYRWYGKLGNQTPGRLTGFRVELGTGVGGAFNPSVVADGVKLTVVSNAPFGNFPGGLFGGSPVNPVPFFSANDADFVPTTTTDDNVEAVTVPAAYSTTFGNWLPLQWVPTAWFFDDDGNPATDDVIQAWFNGTAWLDGSGNLISRTNLATWETTPPTVVEPDGVTLYATWDWDQELYVLAAGGTLTLDEMNTDPVNGIPTTGRSRVPGYSQGAVEDLAKINVNWAIDIEAAQALCAPPCQITVRVTPIASADAASAPVWFGVAPITSANQPLPPAAGGGGGGCAIGGTGRFDPTLPALAALGLGVLGWRRYRAGK